MTPAVGPVPTLEKNTNARSELMQYLGRFFKSASQRLCDVVGADQPLDIGSSECRTGDGAKFRVQFFMRQSSFRRTTSRLPTWRRAHGSTISVRTRSTNR